ncbi:hypothetical protein PSOL_06040 [Candidatus Phytoplasma solani]|uniref:hypothetical protein n=1 Tax=Candidatus Phytoplasma solani TaxID=69896 RepID=UPI0032DAB86B
MINDCADGYIIDENLLFFPVENYNHQINDDNKKLEIVELNCKMAPIGIFFKKNTTQTEGSIQKKSKKF